MEKFTNWGQHDVSYIRSGHVITITIDGDYFTIGKENPNFAIASEAIENKNADALINALRPIEAVKKTMSKVNSSHVTIEKDAVLFDGVPVHGYLIDRILQFNRKGLDFEPLSRFLENLMGNPSRTVVNELYEWLEKAPTPMPITEDGHFLAYKKVKENFHDAYSGRLDYSVGKIVEEPRNTVDDKRENTCSHGLHFCSLGYLPNYGAGSCPKVVILKINPADVVAFPQDYNTSKGRCCKVEVIGVHDKNEKTPAWGDRVYVDTRKEYPKAEPKTNAPVGSTTFQSRADARDFVRQNGGTISSRPGQRSDGGSLWDVTGHRPVSPSVPPDVLGKFHSREAARNSARKVGGRVIDRYPDIYRWHVVAI